MPLSVHAPECMVRFFFSLNRKENLGSGLFLTSVESRVVVADPAKGDLVSEDRDPPLLYFV